LKSFPSKTGYAEESAERLSLLLGELSITTNPAQVDLATLDQFNRVTEYLARLRERLDESRVAVTEAFDRTSRPDKHCHRARFKLSV
jgi:hypothetical protein